MSKLNPELIVFIKSKNCHILDKPNVGTQTLVVLQPGDQVAWLGQPIGTKEFHPVRYRNHTGYVFFTNLSMEYVHPAYLPLRCNACEGTGYVSVTRKNAGQRANNLVPSVCQLCGGSGKHIMEGKAFATSDATATKG